MLVTTEKYVGKNRHSLRDDKNRRDRISVNVNKSIDPQRSSRRACYSQFSLASGYPTTRDNYPRLHARETFWRAHLIDASVTARLAPPGRAVFLFAGVGQVPRGIQGEPPSQLRAADVLRVLRVVPVSLIALPPLVLAVPLEVSHVVLGRRRRAQVDASHALDATTAAFSLLGAAAVPSACPCVIRLHVIYGIGECQRCGAKDMRVRVVAAEIHRAGALAVSSETLITGRRYIAQLRDRYLRAFLRLGFRNLVVCVSQQIGEFVEIAIGGRVVSLGGVVVVVVGLMIDRQSEIRGRIDNHVSIHCGL